MPFNAAYKIKKQNEYKDEFQALQTLIEQRQDFEQAHRGEDPYQKFPTTWSFANVDGWCPLHLAIVLDDFEEVKRLINDKNVDVSAAMPFQNATPLATALQFERLKIAEYLIANGAKITECKRSLLDDVPFARELYDREAKKLLEKAITDRDYKLAAALAAEIGDIATFEHLCSENKLQEVFAKTKYNNDHLLLHLGLSNNQNEIVKFLLQHHYSVNEVDHLNRGVLHLAVANGNLEGTKLLLQHKTDLNIQDYDGRTPLFSAIYDGKEACVEALLSAGADLFVKTYIGETIYHAQSHSKMDISKLIPDTPALLELKQSKTIYDDTPADYANQNEYINLIQDILNDKIRYYLDLNYRDKSYFGHRGNCNGFSFLYQYYDSIGQLDTYFKILELISTWDGTLEALKRVPPFPLNKDHATIEDVFEEFISHMSWFQMNSNLLLEHKIEQHDRATQLSLLKLKLHLVMGDQRFFCDKAKLVELLTIAKRFPQNTRFEIGGFEHKTTFKIEGGHKLKYYDCNFDRRVNKLFEPKDLADLIIDTKYKRINCICSPISKLTDYNELDVMLNAYHFPWEQNYPPTFNYFSDDELPKSQEEAQAFRDASPNHFSHLHIALLTNSQNNSKKIIKDGFCDVDKLALSLVSNDTDAATLLSKIDDGTLSNALQILESSASSPIKNLLYERYKNITNDNGQTLTHLALQSSIFHYLSAFAYLVARDKRNFIAKDHHGVTPLQLYIKLNALYMPYVAMSNLPDKISLKEGQQLLETMHREGSNWFAKQICNAVDNFNQLLGTSLYQFTSLHYFAVKHNTAILKEILQRMEGDLINFQDTEKKETALHLMLAYEPKEHENKDVYYDVIQSLISKTNLNLTNRDGVSCEQLIKNHHDVKIADMLSKTNYCLKQTITLNSYQGVLSREKDQPLLHQFLQTSIVKRK